MYDVQTLANTVAASQMRSMRSKAKKKKKPGEPQPQQQQQQSKPEGPEPYSTRQIDPIKARRMSEFTEAARKLEAHAAAKVDEMRNKRGK